MESQAGATTDVVVFRVENYSGKLDMRSLANITSMLEVWGVVESDGLYCNARARATIQGKVSKEAYRSICCSPAEGSPC
jgi:hypothetical protein